VPKPEVVGKCQQGGRHGNAKRLGGLEIDNEGKLARLLDRKIAGVCTEILNSGVVVMESAKDGARIDDTGPLNRARDRRILVQ
jgi:hypothetical protein